jgi:hypothetical protein
MCRLFAAAGAVVMMAISVMAQTAIRANIPFEFRVGDTVLPAGTYDFDTQAYRVVRISGMDKDLAVPFSPLGRSIWMPKPAKLVFNHYGSDYFLSEVWEGNSPKGRGIPKSDYEISRAKKGPPQRIEAIPDSWRR